MYTTTRMMRTGAFLPLQRRVLAVQRISSSSKTTHNQHLSVATSPRHHLHQQRLFTSQPQPPPPPPSSLRRKDVQRMIRVTRKPEAGSNSSSAANGSINNETKPQSFLDRFLAPKPMPPRNTPAWYAEMVLICTVFGITGTSTMMVVRPAVKDVLGIDGSFRDGPWSYRICSIVVMSPIYASLLVVVGTVFGRHAYFRHFSVKILSRFGIPPEMIDANWKVNKKNFQKW